MDKLLIFGLMFLVVALYFSVITDLVDSVHTMSSTMDKSYTGGE